MEGIPDLLREGYAAYVGKQTRLKIDGKRCDVTIRSMSDNGLWLIQRTGRTGAVSRHITFRELAASDTGDLLDGIPMTGETRILIKGFLALNQGDLRLAREMFDDAGTPIGDALAIRLAATINKRPSNR